MAEAAVLTAQARHAAEILDMWAEALRGDWSNIDGRQSSQELSAISAYLRGERQTLTPADVGICVLGGTPHWIGLGCEGGDGDPSSVLADQAGNQA